jgi:hypothetical protein
MTLVFLDSNKIERLQDTMNHDPEFKLAARYMSEDILLEMEDSQCIITIRDGVITGIKPAPPSRDPWGFSLKATAESWEKLLQSPPPPFFTGLNAVMVRGNLQIGGSIEVAFAYFWALNRMLDIMRELQNE